MGREGEAPNTGGGTGVNSYSTGHERNTWTTKLELKWSPTDAALAYYLGRSKRNDTLKARFQKIRVGQKLIGTVDAAYFRILSLQRALPLAERLKRTAGGVAENRRRLYEEQLTSAEEYYRAEDRATRAVRLCTRLRNELERRRNILASAMGLSPDYCVDGGFFVCGRLRPPCFNCCMSALELEAIKCRPEAYEAGLNHLNSVNDVKRTVVKYMPKVTGFYRYSHDKDKFLYHKEWSDVGMYVYFDLLDWVSNVFESRAACTAEVKAHKEMGTVALGIVSQVRLAALKYTDSMDELRSVESSLKSRRSVLGVLELRAEADDADMLAVKEAKADALSRKIDRIRALGEANAALAELHAATGVNYLEPPLGGPKPKPVAACALR